MPMLGTHIVHNIMSVKNRHAACTQRCQLLTKTKKTQNERIINS